jgi:S-adenosylmethionine synthetase
MSDNFIFSSGSVTSGHPDKLCDQVSDAIVDQFLLNDKHSRVVAECAASSGVMFISAHFASKAHLDVAEIARGVIRNVGYPADVFNADTCTIMTSLQDHTATGYQPVNVRKLSNAEIDQITSKHQVSVFGYACDQTSELIPLPIWLAHRITHWMDSKKVKKKLPYLLPDGKAQVGIEYRDGKPHRIHSITLVASHTQEIASDLKRLHKDLEKEVLEPVMQDLQCRPDKKTRISVNPDGPLIGGGPSAHSGLTGRKTGIDTYGEYARHSGTALSGKDPFRIDRVGAYAARHAAKNIVAAGLARECEVQLSYSVGVAAPVSIRVRTFGTGIVDDVELANRVRSVFDFRVAGIVREFHLQTLPSEHKKKGFYRRLSVYGHMGRTTPNVPWEQTDKTDALK